MICSRWKTATFDIDRATEFTGDDVDQYSSLVDLEKPYTILIIDAPTIDASTVSVAVQEEDGVTQVPVLMHYTKSDDSSAAWATTAGTGGYSITCLIYGHQFVRIKCGSNQTADRVFKVRGVRA